jgi:anaerobic selenocysteine-containing dehydrogenase
MDGARTVRVTCTHDCPDACSALVTVEDGRATSIRADQSHPITGRHLCVKVDRYLERVYSPDRVASPLRRVGPKGDGAFEPTSWDSALDEIVARWSGIIGESGPEAILPYSYLGSMGLLSGFGTLEALMAKLGASDLERSICGPQWFRIMGTTGWAPAVPEHLPDARMVVVWGMDPVSTSIHTWELIRQARKRNGAQLVVIDPYVSRTAKYADLHLRPHPGTDGAIALAVAHVIFRDDLLDHDYVRDFTTDVDLYRTAVSEWAPSRAAAECGVPADLIESFAHQYAGASPSAIRIGVGMQRAAGAGAALRAIQCLPALTGQWRYPAGGYNMAVSIGLADPAALSRPDLTQPGTRTINMIQLGRALTDPELDPPVRALFVWNSNPAVIAADQQRVLAGLRRDDLFTVVHEQFLTDTARHADIVLPATTMLEAPDVVGSWGFPYLSWNEAAIAPIGESKSNAELARLLAARLGYDDDVFTASDDELMHRVLTSPALEAAGLTPERVRAEGFVRAGSPIGSAPNAGRTFAFSSAALGELGMHPVVEYRPPTGVPGPGRYPFRLLTLKRHYSINSSYGSLPVFRGAEPEGRAEIHPDDAVALGIGDGEPVRVYNDLGEVVYTAAITDRTPPGCVAVPFGRWRDNGGAAGVGATANSLTSDELGDVANGPTFCDNLVGVALVRPAPAT